MRFSATIDFVVVFSSTPLSHQPLLQPRQRKFNLGPSLKATLNLARYPQLMDPIQSRILQLPLKRHDISPI